MASHPYISGPGNITQMIGYLRKNFPATVTADTVKKLGLASNNESYVINVLQFLGLIDEQGKRTDTGHDAMTKHEEDEFRASFKEIVKGAYADLFEIRSDGAWTMTKGQLIGYFRSADKTSEVIGGRQAGVFIALRELAGYATEAATVQGVSKAKSNGSAKAKSPPRSSKLVEQKTQERITDVPSFPSPTSSKGDIALTVRIEINLPAEGSQETYDAIFKSIKANLYP